MSQDMRFVVRRLNWRTAGDRYVRLPGEARVASFGTFEAAEADRSRREHEVRARVNPFECGTAFHYLTTLPEPVFCDWVEDAGLTPLCLTADNRDWAGWWRSLRKGMTDEQRARVWEGLNRVRFFDVVERPAGAVAYAVVKVLWEWNDMWYEPGAEGGRTVLAFRDRERAEAECRRLSAGARREGDSGSVSVRRWQLDRWPDLGPDVGTNSHEAFDELGVPLYEVVEIDLGGNEG